MTNQYSQECSYFLNYKWQFIQLKVNENTLVYYASLNVLVYSLNPDMLRIIVNIDYIVITTSSKGIENKISTYHFFPSLFPSSSNMAVRINFTA